MELTLDTYLSEKIRKLRERKIDNNTDAHYNNSIIHILYSILYVCVHTEATAIR